MQRFIIPIILVVVWLVLWASDTGLLVFAKVEGSERVCYYLIGPSIVRDSWPAMYRPRCRLFVRI